MMMMKVVSLVVGLLLCSLLASAKDDPAPETFVVTFNTTKGVFELAVTRSWSPLGVDRFYTLVAEKYYDLNYFFRVIRSPQPFVAQWGISGNPKISNKWANETIPNDPVTKSNLRGYVSFAADYNGTYACCRSTQIYVNYGNNSYLDAYGFSPFGYVQSGMDITDQFYSQYGENPDQDFIYSEGNKYLEKNFPLLDHIFTARLKK